jgi:tetratricopeptide (TPR) repeat protein
MRGMRRHSRACVLVATALPLCATVLVSIIAAFWAASLAAQATHGSHGKHWDDSLLHKMLPTIPDDRVKGPDNKASTGADDESCFMWPLTGIRSPTMGVASLEVSRQARKDFHRACSEASDKKLAQAEEHLRKVLREDARYPAAWVLLGQVLKAQQKPDEVRHACSQALKADPNYLPADLCLADICAVEQRWEEMLRFANTAVALDPANDPRVYFYAAGAYFGLHRLPEAEKSALKAEEIDKAKREPRIYFLMAQIYEIERKPDAEAAQLQEYLNFVTDPQEVVTVKKYLADLTRNRR